MGMFRTSRANIIKCVCWLALQMNTSFVFIRYIADDMEWWTIDFALRAVRDAVKAKDFMCSSPIRVKRLLIHSNWPRKVNCSRSVAAVQRNRRVSRVRGSRVGHHDLRPIHVCCTMIMSAVHSIMGCAKATTMHACAPQ